MAGKPRIKKLTQEQLRTLMGGAGRGHRKLAPPRTAVGTCPGKCNTEENCDTQCTAVKSCRETMCKNIYTAAV